MKIQLAKPTMILLALAGIAGLFAATPTVRADAIQAWGNNQHGQVGNNSSGNNIHFPVNVHNMTGDILQIAAGGEHSLAIRNGAAFAWGLNDEYQLTGVGGFNQPNDRDTPVAITALSSGVTDVAASLYHSLAVQNGQVYAWGGNFDGQLGDGTVTRRRANPVTVTGLSSGVTDVEAGYNFSLAIKNGGVYAWGENTVGQLGIGQDTDENEYFTAPEPVAGLSSGVTDIAAGFYTSMAIQNGQAFAWGYNDSGQLGNGTMTTTSTGNHNSDAPVAVTGLASGVTDIAMGYTHALAIKDGNVYGWGNGFYGQNGDDQRDDTLVPHLALDLDLDLIAVAASEASSYALSVDGSIYVWGLNDEGQLGVTTLGDSITDPVKLTAPSGFMYKAVSANASFGNHALATLTSCTAPGTTTINGDYILEDTTLCIHLDGPTPGTEYDVITVLGQVDITDNVDLHLVLSFAPTQGQTFTIVDNGFDFIDGRFENALTEVGAVYSGTEYRFQIKYFGGPDGTDIVLTTLNGVVPEPGTLALLGLGGVMLLGRRRRSTHPGC